MHKTFLSSVCDKKLNSYYYALSNDKIANTQIRQILAKMSLSIIPESLAKKTVVIAIDDTTIAKFGKKFADVQYLYDHSIHDSKNRMVNGHCFVSLTMSVPVKKCYQVPPVALISNIELMHAMQRSSQFTYLL